MAVVSVVAYRKLQAVSGSSNVRLIEGDRFDCRVNVCCQPWKDDEGEWDGWPKGGQVFCDQPLGHDGKHFALSLSWK